MGRKWYGSVINRVDENKNFCKDEIKVGTYCTEYFWSDREAYEVTKVIDQKHLFIRRLKAIRTDDYGMSDIQTYRYEQDLEAPEEELEFRYGHFYRVYRMNPEILARRVEEERNTFTEEFPTEKIENFIMRDFGADKIAKVRDGKEVKRYNKINISFGIADEHYDYSF